MGRRDSSVRVVSGLQAGRPQVQIPAGARDFSILQNVQARSASNSIGAGVTSQEVKQPGCENSQSTPFSDELRISGAIPPFTVCVFTACEGTTLIFLLTNIISRHKFHVSVTIYLKIQVTCDVTPCRPGNNYRRFEKVVVTSIPASSSPRTS